MEVESYLKQQRILPDQGNHLIADFTADTVVVYQAFNHRISEYAVQHQRFGGPEYRRGRMTWIKPGFMWMMYRSGWATKENQERILRLTLARGGWNALLDQGVFSSFRQSPATTEAVWKTRLAQSSVRLQWDPDHGPDGEKLNRRVIQVGLKGEALDRFHEQYLLSIEDITDFTVKQRTREPADLLVPVERLVTRD